MSMDAPTMDVLRKQAIAMAMLWLTARNYDYGGLAWFSVRPSDLGLRDDVMPWKAIRVTITAEADASGVKPPLGALDCIHCGKGCCNQYGWFNSYKAAGNGGAKPGSRSAGWSVRSDLTVNCPRCLKHASGVDSSGEGRRE